MSYLEKPRWAVFTQRQHPLKHDISDFFYSNPSLPPGANGDIQSALNYIIAVLYPNYIGTFDTPADLPVAPAPNSYALVNDDGDGKAAGYVFTVLDGTSQWIKRYDVDWSMEGILAETVNRTQYMYVQKYGFDDHDAAGTPLTGIYQGQTIYGGATSGGNLTFNANAFDASGFVQTDNTFRPTSNNTLDIGTSALRFQTGYFGTSVAAGTLVMSSGSITDLSGAISFDNENLTTTGDITANHGFFTTSVEVGPLAGDALILAPGSITDESGAIDFGTTNVTFSGTVSLADFTFTNGSITSASATISFGSNNLSTTGTLDAGNSTFTRVDSDNLRLDGNTLSVLNSNGNLLLTANGTGIVDIQSPLQTLGIDATGVVGVTGQFNIDNIRIDGNVISSTDLNGNITLQPNGTGFIETTSDVFPSVDDTNDIGAAALRYQDLFLSGNIGDGTNLISLSTLLSLRDINTGALAGMALFYNGLS